MEHTREKFSSRLGFILISAGCAIGLGNVWRFPYVTGQNGGAIFVLIYMAFLLIFGLPIMVMEFAVGRASKKSIASAFNLLEPKGTKWHLFSYLAVLGNYMLMMFYTTVAGWTLNYLFKTATGKFDGLNNTQIQSVFDSMLCDPFQSVFWMVIVVLIGFSICVLGLQSGVEKITKFVMTMLFILMIIVAIKSLTLPNSLNGLEFYLKPDINKVKDIGIFNVISSAMGQAFFSLGLGVGSMGVFGSYIGKERSLTGEALYIIFLDLLIGIISGLIIFPACTSFGISSNSGPGLLFVTLPNVFNSMGSGRVWGSLFFVAMSFAALSTIIAVFENIVSFGIDLFGWNRKKSVSINIFLMILLSLPCALGDNLLNFIQPFGQGSNIQSLEDFIISGNIVLIGSVIYVLFCTRKNGWGYNNFIEEANCGVGIKFPRNVKIYISYILPILIVIIFIQGYISKFFN